MATLPGRITGRIRHGQRMTNWAKTYWCEPDLYFEPENEEDIREILAFAREKDKTVKVVGSGHSPSDIACTSDFMLDLRNMNKVLKVDEDQLQVTVQAGCLISHLNHNILPKHNMALSVQGTVCELTTAGVISTGTHGTGINYGILSSYVLQIRMMKASGEIITVNKDCNPELFPAVVLSLGALGVILEVTLQCERAYNLHQYQFPQTLDNVVSKLEEYIHGSDHFRFMWYPHTDSVVCFSASRTDKPHEVKASWFWDMFVGYYLLQVVLWLSTFSSCLVPVINRLYFRLLCSKASEKVDRSDRVFNFNCLFKQYVTEWAIPSDKVSEVLQELNDWINMHKFPAHFPVEVRFVKEDQIYLSPCYGQRSCYINIIMYRPFNKTVSHTKYWNAYEAIMAKYGGRPHWAKAHTCTGSDFQKLYPKWAQFCSIRESLDPNGMFLNANLEQVFRMRPRPSVNYI